MTRFNEERFIWIDPGGDAFDFETYLMTPLWGMTNLHAPPPRVTRQPLAGQHGALLQLVEHDVRPFALPVRFNFSDESIFRTQMGLWAHRLDPARGTGILRFVRTEGTHRDLACICVAGLGFSESPDNRGPGWLETVLELEADDPYWYGTTVSQSWAVPGDDPPKWFDPPTKSILPLTFSSSAVIGESTVVIDADVDVWPVWTVNGPGNTVTLVHQRTLRTIVWDGTLEEGDVLVIDTRPKRKTVTVNGLNAFAGLTAWDMWPFQGGSNDFNIVVTGSDTTTLVNAQWRAGYLGP